MCPSSTKCREQLYLLPKCPLPSCPHQDSPSKVLQEVSVQHQLHGAWIWGSRVWCRVEKIAEVSCLQAVYLGISLWDEQDFLWEITLPNHLEITLLTCWKQGKSLSMRVPNLLLSLTVANSGGTSLWSQHSWVTNFPGWPAQLCHSLQWIASIARLCEPKFIPDICLYNPRAASVRFLQTTATSALLTQSTHLSQPD